jgi:hypothetical protein
MSKHTIKEFILLVLYRNARLYFTNSAERYGFYFEIIVLLKFLQNLSHILS